MDLEVEAVEDDLAVVEVELLLVLRAGAVITKINLAKSFLHQQKISLNICDLTKVFLLEKFPKKVEATHKL